MGLWPWQVRFCPIMRQRLSSCQPPAQRSIKKVTFQHCTLGVADFEEDKDLEGGLPFSLDLREPFLSSLFFDHDSLVEVALEKLCQPSCYVSVHRSKMYGTGSHDQSRYQQVSHNSGLIKALLGLTEHVVTSLRIFPPLTKTSARSPKIKVHAIWSSAVRHVLAVVSGREGYG